MTITATPNTAIYERATEPLLATDRCDYCGAQAWVHVVMRKSATALLFCRGHANKHLDALTAQAAIITDGRHLLEAQESGLRDAGSA